MELLLLLAFELIRLPRGEMAGSHVGIVVQRLGMMIDLLWWLGSRAWTIDRHSRGICKST